MTSTYMSKGEGSNVNEVALRALAEANGFAVTQFYQCDYDDAPYLSATLKDEILDGTQVSINGRSLEELENDFYNLTGFVRPTVYGGFDTTPALPEPQPDTPEETFTSWASGLIHTLSVGGEAHIEGHGELTLDEEPRTLSQSEIDAEVAAMDADERALCAKIAGMLNLPEGVVVVAQRISRVPLG